MADLVPESEQQYGSILTVLGESAEQNGKMLKKPVEFTHIAFGDANDTYVQPDRKSQSLVNELYRVPVNSVDVLQPTPDSVPILKVEALIPDDIHDIVIREFAAVATFNGQSYFHAVGNCARVYVPNPVNNGQLNNPVSLEMTFVITSAEPIVEIDPNVITASREWVNYNADKSFDDLRELQSSNYRFEDKRVYLQGRFKPNDGGAAYYKIKRDLIANGVYIHDLGDGWFAELQTDDNGASVVALGLNPEAEDNRFAWRALNDLNLFTTVTVPAKTFRFSQFVPNNITIRAEPGAKFEFFYTTTPVFVSFVNRENVNIYDLWMHSTEKSLEWQRVDITDAKDVNIYRGKISGFLHDVPAPNAWGAYFKRSKRCYLHDVEFEDNSQSDIAIVDGNEDIGIYRPKHTNDDLVVNFEPNGNEINRRIEVSGFYAKKVYLLVNTRGVNPLTEISIKNATTKDLFYDGADVSFENFKCERVYGDSLQYFTGVINAINSFGIGDNLLIDPKLVVVGANDGNWKVKYSTITPKNRYELFKHQNYVGVRLNPNNLNGVVFLENLHPISVESGKTYYVHVTGTAYVPEGAPHASDYIRLEWKNASGEIVQSDPVRPFRTLAGETSPIRSEGVFVTAPENATHLTVILANAFNSTTISCIFTTITLHEARMDSTQFNDVLSKYHSLSNEPRTVYKSKMTSTDFNYQLPMLLNDVISVDGSKQMFRCIDDEYHNSEDHWIGKFKEI
ncbi:phage tail protein [Vibrio navarrensis]|nr:phage tail protein [Vibrio navarrensis]